MSSKKTTPSKNNHSKSTSRSKSKQKTNRKEKHQPQINLSSLTNVKKFESKKKVTNLVKKKIEDLKTPELIIKASYKNKKLSILIGSTE